MAEITVRDFPEELLAEVRTRADIHGRSLDSELVALVEAQLHEEERELEAIQAGVRRDVERPPTEDLLREDRNGH